MSDTGYITRDNLDTPLGHLALFVGTPWPTYDFTDQGLDPGQAMRRRQVAESMYVPGAGELGSWLSTADATFQFSVTSGNGTDLDTAIGVLVNAVCNQPSWELHVSFEGTRDWAWTCWDADEPRVGFAAPFWGPDASAPVMWCPVTVTCKRDPVLVDGPYQIA